MNRLTKRILVGSAVALPVAVAGLAAHLGWFSRQQPAAVAMGWPAVPAAERPATEALPESPKIRWLGHAGLVIDWNGVRLAVDPNLSSRCTIARRLTPAPVTPAELGPLDLVLITHAHYDHLDLPTLLGIPSIDRLVVPKGADRYLPAALTERRGVTTLAVGDEFLYRSLRVTAVPARHNGTRGHPFHGPAIAVGYVISDGEQTLYVAGDTGWDDHFAAIGKQYHPDIAIVPIGAYAPRFPLKYYHLSPEEAVEAARATGARRVIPYHMGTFVLSLDGADAALPRFARAAAAAHMAWELPQLATPADLAEPPADSPDHPHSKELLP